MAKEIKPVQPVLPGRNHIKKDRAFACLFVFLFFYDQPWKTTIGFKRGCKRGCILDTQTRLPSFRLFTEPEMGTLVTVVIVIVIKYAQNTRIPIFIKYYNSILKQDNLRIQICFAYNFSPSN